MQRRGGLSAAGVMARITSGNFVRVLKESLDKRATCLLGSEPQKTYTQELVEQLLARPFEEQI
jgi:hypothetical protein